MKVGNKSVKLAVETVEKMRVGRKKPKVDNKTRKVDSKIEKVGNKTRALPKNWTSVNKIDSKKCN
ncbi:hypothetical protein ACPJHQ_25595 [Rossellomorea sp. H39__3]